MYYRAGLIVFATGLFFFAMATSTFALPEPLTCFMNIILKYFPDLSPLQQQQFAQLGELYHDWNNRINVISRKDIDNLYTHHVLHSLAIARFVKFAPGTRVLDAGTGGGFPGVPLAIMFPQTEFLLVDSVAKKLKVTEAVANATELKNINLQHQRVEKVKGRFDFGVSRAVAQTSVLHHWLMPAIKDEKKSDVWNGLVFLKGGDLKEELKGFKHDYRLVSLQKYFAEPFFETKKLLYIPA